MWSGATVLVAALGCDGAGANSHVADVDVAETAKGNDPDGAGPDVAHDEVGAEDFEIAPEGEVTSESDVTPESDTTPDIDVSIGYCQGAVVEMTQVHGLPYVMVGVDGTEGYFLVDWGTTATAIDPTGFNPYFPEPLAGSSDRWDGFSFFGPWGTVRMSQQDFSWFDGPIRQAGILGTDFLALNAFVVDWDAGTLARAEPGAGCTDAALLEAGMRPLSTAGYYARDLDEVFAGMPNIPTIPARVGAAQAPAQIDTGYDDALVGPAININHAFRAAIADASLVRAPELDLVLTTCVPGLVESVDAWRLAIGATLELVGEDDNAVRSYSDAILFEKDTPSAAFRCGGIGTWATPGAQLGVSFVARGGRAVFDPVRSRVWLPRDP